MLALDAVAEGTVAVTVLLTVKTKGRHPTVPVCSSRFVSPVPPVMFAKVQNSEPPQSLQSNQILHPKTDARRTYQKMRALPFGAPLGTLNVAACKPVHIVAGLNLNLIGAKSPSSNWRTARHLSRSGKPKL